MIRILKAAFVVDLSTGSVLYMERGWEREEEGDHAKLGAYVLKNYATTDELQHKATLAAKKSLQLKIIGTNTLYERFMKTGKAEPMDR